MEKLKVVSLFSGIGAFEKALERQCIPFELVNYCEIDKYASKAYSAIHKVDEKLNLGDITKVKTEDIPEFDLMTWGFPCTDISVAGGQAGFIDEEGNLTRSGLYYEGLRILKDTQPKYSIIENVKALTGKKFKDTFQQILDDLDEAGYNTYWKVLNAKDYGVPQNRERVFLVSIRRDVDNHSFTWEDPFDNGLRLKDMLEREVDEKYFIDEEKTLKLLEQLIGKEISNAIRCGGRGSVDRHSLDMVAVQINRGEAKIKADNICSCLDANYYKGLDNHAARTGIIQDIAVPCLTPDRVEKRQNGRRFKEDGEPMFSLTTQDRHGVLIQVGELDIKGNESIRRVYSEEGISPTLTSMQGGNRQPKVLVIDDTQGFDGVRTYEDYIPTLRSKRTGLKITDFYRIRKLTPLECWRLMGFDDQDFRSAKEAGISDSQLYKQAGNSIVVNVLETIFKELFK